MLGPDKNGQFKPVLVRGIQENRVDTLFAKKGQSVTLNVKSLNKKDQTVKVVSFKKGMILVGLNQKMALQLAKKGNPTSALEQFCIREFEAEVVILHHATTIQ